MSADALNAVGSALLTVMLLGPLLLSVLMLAFGRSVGPRGVRLMLGVGSGTALLFGLATYLIAVCTGDLIRIEIGVWHEIGFFPIHQVALTASVHQLTGGLPPLAAAILLAVACDTRAGSARSLRAVACASGPLLTGVTLLSTATAWPLLICGGVLLLVGTLVALGSEAEVTASDRLLVRLGLPLLISGGMLLLGMASQMASRLSMLVPDEPAFTLLLANETAARGEPPSTSAGLWVWLGCLVGLLQYPLCHWLSDAKRLSPTGLILVLGLLPLGAGAVVLKSIPILLLSPGVLVAIGIVGCLSLYAAAWMLLTATDDRTRLATLAMGLTSLSLVAIATGFGGGAAAAAILLTLSSGFVLVGAPLLPPIDELPPPETPALASTAQGTQQQSVVVLRLLAIGLFLPLIGGAAHVTLSLLLYGGGSVGGATLAALAFAAWVLWSVGLWRAVWPHASDVSSATTSGLRFEWPLLIVLVLVALHLGDWQSLALFGGVQFFPSSRMLSTSASPAAAHLWVGPVVGLVAFGVSRLLPESDGATRSWPAAWGRQTLFLPALWFVLLLPLRIGSQVARLVLSRGVEAVLVHFPRFVLSYLSWCGRPLRNASHEVHASAVLLFSVVVLAMLVVIGGGF